MAIYAFYPSKPEQRRADGIGFILAEGDDEASARVEAQALVAGNSIAAFKAVLIGGGMQSVAVQGLPVGHRNGTVWPVVTRGGGFIGN